MIEILKTIVVWWLLWTMVSGATLGLVFAFGSMFDGRGQRPEDRDQN